jgi:hypothetical protein
MEGENNQNTEQNPGNENNSQQQRSDDTQEKDTFPSTKHRFTPDNQPPPQAKSAGLKAAKFNRDVIRKMLAEPLNIDWESEMGKELLAKIGPRVKEVPAGVLMTEGQIAKAMRNQDSYAFNSVTDQGLGRPVQAIAQTNSAGDDLPAIGIMLPPGMAIGILPSNTEGTAKRESNYDGTGHYCGHCYYSGFYPAHPCI